MKRYSYIGLPVLVLAWLIAAIVTGSAGLGLFSSGSSSKRAKVSPSCLPSTLTRSARLPGTHLDVSPAPETDTANPDTQISFTGVPGAQIHAVTVRGEHSGSHSGHLRGYSQGDGASFVPDSPFKAGERVAVRAVIGASGGGQPIAFAFHVDTPYPTARVTEFPNPQAPSADNQSFYTMPGVQVPLMTVTLPDRDPAAGDILTTNGPGPGQYGPLIYTPQGRLVWFQRLPAGLTAENLSEQSYEGQRVLTWWKGRVLSLGFGQGEDLVMNSHYEVIARVLGGNGMQADLHDFQIVPGGVAYITAFNPIRCNLAPVHGAADGAIVDTAIQEIDMRSGLVRWEWHSLDHVAAEESEVEAANDTTPWDWFHINSIDPQPSGRLLISARSTWASYQLDGASGKILWRLGGNRSSFKMGPGTRTAWQHDGRVLADGEITLFDDGANPPIHRQSRGVRIVLDAKTHEARLVQVFTHANPPLLAASQGNMQTLPDGSTVIGYGSVPAISQYDRAGRLIFDAHQPYDMSFYRAFRFPWRGQPASPPALLASLNDTSEETIVHMSWNGATDVSAWRVLAGGRSGALSNRASIPAEAFESSVTLPSRYARVIVQALDSHGRVLGTSKTTGVITYAAALAGRTNG